MNEGQENDKHLLHVKGFIFATTLQNENFTKYFYLVFSSNI